MEKKMKQRNGETGKFVYFHKVEKNWEHFSLFLDVFDFISTHYIVAIYYHEMQVK